MKYLTIATLASFATMAIPLVIVGLVLRKSLK